MRSRISMWWLFLLELIAFIATGSLFLLQIVDDKQVLWILALSVAIAGGLFILLVKLTSGRPQKPRTRSPQFVSEGDADEKIEQYLKMGRQLLTEERYDEARKMFEEVLSRNSSHWQAYNYLGLTNSRKGLFDEAKEAYEKAISLEYNYASAHFNLATACEKLGDRNLALDRWKRYVEVGEEVGERPDLLEHARQRINKLAEQAGQDEDGEM